MEKKPEFPVLKEKAPPRSGINRREMVRLLGVAGAGFALPGVAGGHPVHKHLADAATLLEADAKIGAQEWAAEVLDSHQNETLIVLAERIVPGSTKAQVNRFIDLLLSVDTRENQQKFINSLSAIDAAALGHFAHPFKALTKAQQNELLTLASTMKNDPTHGDGGGFAFAVPSKSVSDQPRFTLRHHFENLKGWISGAYYSSEIGMRELGWTGDLFFDSFPGCEHPEGHH